MNKSAFRVSQRIMPRENVNINYCDSFPKKNTPPIQLDLAVGKFRNQFKANDSVNLSISRIL